VTAPPLSCLAADDAVVEHLGPAAGWARLRALQIRSPWRGRAVWAVFRPGDRAPAVVVKIDVDPGSQVRLRNEHAALTALQHHAGVQHSVPRPVALQTRGASVVLVQTGVAGTSLAHLGRRRLRPSLRHAAREHAAVLDWIGRLQSTDGAEHRRLDADSILCRIDALGAKAQRLADRLRASRTAWDGLPVPVVPGHGDLAPGNVLWDRGAVKVVDWEGGVARRSALSDVVYFLQHHARRREAAGRQRRTARAGFRAAFVEGPLSALSAATLRRHVTRLALPAEATEALFVATVLELADGEGAAAHASLLRTAWTEHLRTYAGAKRPPLAQMLD